MLETLKNRQDKLRLNKRQLIEKKPNARSKKTWTESKLKLTGRLQTIKPKPIKKSPMTKQPRSRRPEMMLKLRKKRRLMRKRQGGEKLSRMR